MIITIVNFSGFFFFALMNHCNLLISAEEKKKSIEDANDNGGLRIQHHYCKDNQKLGGNVHRNDK